MPGSTYSNVGQRTNVYAPIEFLENAQPRQILTNFGATKPLPKNKSETMKFRRSVPFPALTVALSEGVTPPSRTMQFEDVSVTAQEWGDLVEATDRVRELSEDPVVKEATKELAKQAVTTMETVLWGVLRAGTAAGFANGTVRTDVNTALSLSKIRAAIATLDNAYADPVEDMVSASVNYGTSAIEPTYLAFGHTNMKNDIRNLPGFVPVAEYGQMKPVSKYEFGSVEEVRFILSPLFTGFLGGGSATLNGMQNSSSAVDVYPLVIVGKNAYAQVPLKGNKSVEMFVHNTADKSDPLNQRDLIGAKYWFTGVRLNDNWMYRIECGVTSL